MLAFNTKCWLQMQQTPQKHKTLMHFDPIRMQYSEISPAAMQMRQKQVERSSWSCPNRQTGSLRTANLTWLEEGQTSTSGVWAPSLVLDHWNEQICNRCPVPFTEESGFTWSPCDSCLRVWRRSAACDTLRDGLGRGSEEPAVLLGTWTRAPVPLSDHMLE